MSFPKLLSIFAVILFTIIGVSALIKNGKNSKTETAVIEKSQHEIELSGEVRTIVTSYPTEFSNGKPLIINANNPIANAQPYLPRPTTPLPDVDRVQEFFNKTEPKFPVVQTIIYKSKVSWQKGRPAWLSDYASHYTTSRHFIARSLNGKPDYLKQDITEGGRFNVLHPAKNIAFYLLVDTSRSKMWFYYLDLDANERVLVKTYTVGLGRVDSTKSSGLLTPLGKYSLGNKVSIHKPKMTGFHSGKKVELIRIFGTRWIPFGKESSDCTAYDGFGLHGVPWVIGEKGELVEQTDSLGKYESDGCIRLATKDIEELFAIIITRPTTIDLVKDFYEAKLPGVEREGS